MWVFDCLLDDAGYGLLMVLGVFWGALVGVGLWLDLLPVFGLFARCLFVVVVCVGMFVTLVCVCVVCVLRFGFVVVSCLRCVTSLIML